MTIFQDRSNATCARAEDGKIEVTEKVFKHANVDLLALGLGQTSRKSVALLESQVDIEYHILFSEGESVRL